MKKKFHILKVNHPAHPYQSYYVTFNCSHSGDTLPPTLAPLGQGCSRMDKPSQFHMDRAKEWFPTATIEWEEVTTKDYIRKVVNGKYRTREYELRCQLATEFASEEENEFAMELVMECNLGEEE